MHFLDLKFIQFFLKVLFQIIKILFAIAIFISYNLQFYVAADIIWTYVYRSSKYLRSLNEKSTSSESLTSNNSSKSSSKMYSLIHNAFRSAMVVFTFCLAILVPKIDLFISLVGSIASSTLAIIIPPILDLVVFWPESNRSKPKLIKNILIILFGIYIFIAGTWVSMNDIIKYLMKSE